MRRLIPTLLNLLTRPARAIPYGIPVCRPAPPPPAPWPLRHGSRTVSGLDKVARGLAARHGGRLFDWRVSPFGNALELEVRFLDQDGATRVKSVVL